MLPLLRLTLKQLQMNDDDSVFTCEVCDGEMDFTPTYTTSTYYVIDKDHGVQATLYFCTLQCLMKWARAERKAGVS